MQPAFLRNQWFIKNISKVEADILTNKLDIFGRSINDNKTLSSLCRNQNITLAYI